MPEILDPIKLIQFMTEAHTCGECKKFHRPECIYSHVRAERGRHVIEAHDKACDEFEQRAGRHRGLGSTKKRKKKKKERDWKLALYEPIPQTMKPCGFYGDVLTESVWLPYEDQESGEVQLRPSLIIAEKNKGYNISDFWKGIHNVKGTFPSKELQSLMTVQAVQMLESKATIEPKKVDEEIDKVLKKHLAIPDAEKILAKRWIEGTFVYDVFDAYPIECVLGVSESGKSRLNLVNLALCYHAEGLIDPTEATIFRSKEEDRVTLCIDEAEYLNNPNLYHTLRILINASYSKYSGYVSRYDEIEGKRVKKRFDLYSPMAICGIGGLEGVTLSRAFRIVMRRVNRDYPKANPNDYQTLRNKLYVLRIRHAFQIRELYEKTDISNTVTARFEELFKPLFTMTKFMGTQEEWNILAEWCKDYQQNFRTEALNVAQEEMVLTCLAKLEPQPNQPEWYSLKQLTYAFNLQYSKQVSERYVSNILHRLGIIKRKKVHGLTLIYCSADLLNEASRRIGVSLTDLPPPPSHPAQPLEWESLKGEK